MRTAFVVVLTFLLIGLLPMWPTAEPLGFQNFPVGLIGLFLFIVLWVAVLRPRGRPRTRSYR